MKQVILPFVLCFSFAIVAHGELLQKKSNIQNEYIKVIEVTSTNPAILAIRKN